MVSFSLAGSAPKPGNISPTIQGEKRIPAKVIAAMTMVRRVKQVFARRRAPSSPSWARVSEKIGTKAEVSAPSAKKRRSMLGIMKAAKKASVAKPAPKRRDTTMSRTIPMMRERRVADPRIPAARAICFVSDMQFLEERLRAFISKTRGEGEMKSHQSF